MTVGISIPVPAPYAAELHGWREWAGDPLAGSVAPHITLVPPTAVPVVDLDRVVDEAAEACAAHPAFTVRLRGAGTFRPVSDVVFIAIAEGIASCEQLACSLEAGRLQAERAFPYHPHVTVAQDVPPATLDAVFTGLEDFRADFVVREVWMHQQDVDGSWLPVAELALRDDGQVTAREPGSKS